MSYVPWNLGLPRVIVDQNSRNLIHASDSFDSASKEIGLWFAQDELAEYKVSRGYLSLPFRQKFLWHGTFMLTTTADHLGTFYRCHVQSRRADIVQDWVMADN